MVEFLGSLFSSIFGTHSIIATILISMFPIIELKGGIPIGMSVDYWGENALNGTEAFLYSLLGSCLVVPIIAIIFIPIMNFLKRSKFFKKLGIFIEEKVQKHSNEINEKMQGKKNQTLLKCFLIFLFVAVPLPLTGVWTGTCVAIIVGLNYWQSVLSVILGNIVAGLIITFVCSVFPQITTILSIIFLIIVLLILIFMIVKFIIHYTKKEEQKDVVNVKKDDN